jgi:hypothetical protein
MAELPKQPDITKKRPRSHSPGLSSPGPPFPTSPGPLEFDPKNLKKTVFAYRTTGQLTPVATLVVYLHFICDPETVVDPRNDEEQTLANTAGCISQSFRGVRIPRDVCIVSKNALLGYTYAGQTPPRKCASRLELALIDRMNTFIEWYLGADQPQKVNALLKNYYRDQEDSVSPHQDKVHELVGPLVVAVSFGEKREITFRPATGKKFMAAQNLARGDTKETPRVINGLKYITLVHEGIEYLVIKDKYEFVDPTQCLWAMEGPMFQVLLTHGIEKEKGKVLGGRVSYTGRCHK